MKKMCAYADTHTQLDHVIWSSLCRWVLQCVVPMEMFRNRIAPIESEIIKEQESVRRVDQMTDDIVRNRIFSFVCTGR